VRARRIVCTSTTLPTTTPTYTVQETKCRQMLEMFQETVQRFQVLTLVSELYNAQFMVYWVVIPCRPVDRYRCSRKKMSCFDLQAKEYVQAATTECEKKRSCRRNHYSAVLSKTFVTEIQAARFSRYASTRPYCLQSRRIVISVVPLGFQQGQCHIFLVSFRIYFNVVK
jgi:hypothetical protein